MPGTKRDPKGSQKTQRPKSEVDRDEKEAKKTPRPKSELDKDAKFDGKAAMKKSEGEKDAQKRKTPRPGEDVKQTAAEKKDSEKKVEGDTKPSRDVVDRNTRKLFEAVRRGQTHNIEEFIRLGANVNGRDEEGKTPIIRAAELRNNTVQALLMLKNVDVNAQDKLQRTALHFEAAQGDTESVKQLLAHGANIDVKDVEGRTPLHFAVNRDHLSTADILVFCGADGKIKDKTRVTAESICQTQEMWKLMQRSREITFAIKQEYMSIHRTTLTEDTVTDLNSIGLKVETPKDFSKTGVCFLCRRVRPEYSHTSLVPKNKELLISDTFEFRLSGSQYKGKVKVHIPMYTKPEPYEEVHIKTSKKPILGEDSEEIVDYRREESSNQWTCSVTVDLKEINAFVLVTRPRVEHFKVGSKGGVFVSEVDDFIKLDIPEKSFSDKGDVTLELVPRPAYTKEELGVKDIDVTSISNFFEINHTNDEQPQNDVTVTLPLPVDHTKDETDLYILSRRNPLGDESELSLWEIVCVNPCRSFGKTTFKASHFSCELAANVKANKANTDFRGDSTPSIAASEEKVEQHPKEQQVLQNGDFNEEPAPETVPKEEQEDSTEIQDGYGPIEANTQQSNESSKPVASTDPEQMMRTSTTSVKKEADGSKTSLECEEDVSDLKYSQEGYKKTDQKNKKESQDVKDVSGTGEIEDSVDPGEERGSIKDGQPLDNASKGSSRASSHASIKEVKHTQAVGKEDNDSFFDEEEEKIKHGDKGEDLTSHNSVDNDLEKGKGAADEMSTASLHTETEENNENFIKQNQPEGEGAGPEKDAVKETEEVKNDGSVKDNVSIKSWRSKKSVKGSQITVRSHKSDFSTRNVGKRLDQHSMRSSRTSLVSVPRSTRKGDSVDETGSVRSKISERSRRNDKTQRARERQIKEAAAVLYHKARKRKCKVSFVVMLNIKDDSTYETLAECTMKDAVKRVEFWKTEGFEDQRNNYPCTNVIPKTVFKFDITGAAQCSLMQKLEFHPKRKDENFLIFPIERKPEGKSEAFVDILMKYEQSEKSEDESIGVVTLHLDGVNSQRKRTLKDAKKDQNFKGFTQDSFLEQVAKKLSEEWYKLGIHLGLAKSVLDKADSLTEDKKLKMLITWRDNCRYRQDLGVRNLTVALRRVGRNDIEEFVIKKLDEWLEKHKKKEDSFCTWLKAARSEQWEIPKGSLVPLSEAFLMTLVDHTGKNLELIHCLGLSSPYINNVEEDTRFFRTPERQMLEMLVQVKRRCDTNIEFFKELDTNLGDLGLTEARGWYRDTAQEWCSQQKHIEGDALVEQLVSFLEETQVQDTSPEGAEGGQ